MSPRAGRESRRGAPPPLLAFEFRKFDHTKLSPGPTIDLRRRFGGKRSMVSSPDVVVQGSRLPTQYPSLIRREDLLRSKIGSEHEVVRHHTKSIQEAALRSSSLLE